MNIIIPSSGMGLRNNSQNPKCLVKLPYGETIVNRQLRLINDAFESPDIFITIGFSRERIKEKVKGVTFIENRNYANNNVAYSISMCLNCIKGDSLIVYGDLVFNSPTLRNIAGSGTYNSFVVADKHSIDEDEVGLSCQGEQVKQFGYNESLKWGQIVYIKEKDRNTFIQESRRNERLLGFEVLNQCIQGGMKLDVIEARSNQIVDVDSSRDMMRVAQLFKK